MVEHGDDPCDPCSRVLGSPSPCAISHDFRPGAYPNVRTRIVPGESTRSEPETPGPKGSTMNTKTPELAPPRERHPAVWNAAYGAAFANAVAVNPTASSARGQQRICDAACDVSDMAVVALEAKDKR